MRNVVDYLDTVHVVLLKHGIKYRISRLRQCGAIQFRPQLLSVSEAPQVR